MSDLSVRPLFETDCEKIVFHRFASKNSFSDESDLGGLVGRRGLRI